MPEESKSRDMELVDKALEILAEHFDATQILCCRYDGGDIGTVAITKGTGNWYARHALVQQWLTKEDEGTRHETRKHMDEENL